MPPPTLLHRIMDAVAGLKEDPKRELLIYMPLKTLKEPDVDNPLAGTVLQATYLPKPSGEILAKEFVAPKEATQVADIFEYQFRGECPMGTRFFNKKNKKQCLVLTAGFCTDSQQTETDADDARAGWSIVFRPTPPELKFPHITCRAQGTANTEEGRAKQIEQERQSRAGVMTARLETRGVDGQPAKQTSSRTQLRAVLAALHLWRWETDHCSEIVIATESQVVVEGATKLAQGWKKNNWRRSGGKKALADMDLWEALMGYIEKMHKANIQVFFWRIPTTWNQDAASMAQWVTKFKFGPDEYTPVVCIRIDRLYVWSPKRRLMGR